MIPSRGGKLSLVLTRAEAKQVERDSILHKKIDIVTNRPTLWSSQVPTRSTEMTTTHESFSILQNDVKHCQTYVAVGVFGFIGSYWLAAILADISFLRRDTLICQKVENYAKGNPQKEKGLKVGRKDTETFSRRRTFKVPHYVCSRLDA